MEKQNKPASGWKAGMDQYYKSKSREQLKKELAEAGFKIKDKESPPSAGPKQSC